MTDRLAAAETALREGRRDDAVAALIELVAADPAQSDQTYLMLARQLYQAGRIEEGSRWAAEAVARHGGNPDLWNIGGVFQRKLGRHGEALNAFDRAIALQPKLVSARANRANLLVEMGEQEKAVDAFFALVALEPGNPLFLQYLSSALATLGRIQEAMARLRQLISLQPTHVEAWIQLAALLDQDHRPADAEAALERALAANPDSIELFEAKAALLRTSGQLARAEALLLELAERFPDLAWIRFHLGDLLRESDRQRAYGFLRHAVALAPDSADYLIGLIQVLERDFGPDEGERLEEAYGLALKVFDLGPLKPGHTKVMSEVFGRVCAFDAFDRLGDFKTLGRSWAESGRHSALFTLLARVRSHEDRLELVEQHRIWGEAARKAAVRAPVRRGGRPRGDRIRLGVMSSDLRKHAVRFFAQPLFDHIDHDRFEVYAYSFSRAREDEVQARIASQVDAFRWKPFMSVRDIAQMIADDGLDVLIELGGSTNMNKLEVMAYRPAPLQASWLGYPHSTGLPTIDRFICDTHNLPTAPGLLLEEPLLLPESWISYGAGFSDEHAIAEALPEERNGALTYGTANHPQKCGRDVLRTWARILARTPGARFAFIRPEGASPSFRRHVLAEFAAEGIGEDRVVFHAVRGKHMALYNEIDITLDPFPLTGGTTTAEALWMGVPVVSLVGEAFYERMSYSILVNADLADLCVFDVEAYADAAVGLAADQARRRDLRHTLRQRIRDSALGRHEAFARNFYDAIAEAVGRGGD